jgi:hypothetical protein
MAQTSAGSFTLRDFSSGLILATQVSDALMPQNSVSEAINVDFNIIGGAIVRKGTSKLSTALSGSSTIDGVSVFSNDGNTINYPVAMSGGSAYFYNGSVWASISSGTFTSGNKVSMTTFGNRIYAANGVNDMLSWSGSGGWSSTNCLTSVYPKYIESFKSRMYAAGDPTNPDRLFFSSVISSGSITWNISSGFININPSDKAGNITALTKASAYLLIFKDRAMYRWDGSSTQPDLLVDIGTSSQRSVKTVKGIVYFFSPYGIYRTDGGYPEWISKPVQDFIDAIPLASWPSVSAYSDDKIYECFIGDVTVNGTVYTNVSLRFDTTSQSWTTRSYSKAFTSFDRFYSSTYGATNIGGTTDSFVMAMNYGNSDAGDPINFSLITAGVELNNLAATKSITGSAYVFTRDGAGSFFGAVLDGEKFVPLGGDIKQFVHRIQNVNLRANQFEFKWYGSTTTSQPVFEGFTLTNVTDEGYQ